MELMEYIPFFPDIYGVYSKCISEGNAEKIYEYYHEMFFFRYFKNLFLMVGALEKGASPLHDSKDFCIVGV